MDAWPVEIIPDPDSLFYRVPVGWLKPGEIRVAPGHFRVNKGSMSCDWQKYSTAAETRSRQGAPERFAIIGMIAGKIREIDALSVVHSPIQGVEGLLDNRAHTSVLGLEHSAITGAIHGQKEKIRTELYVRFHTWEIEPHAPVAYAPPII
jgi:hypothetical protein